MKEAARLYEVLYKDHSNIIGLMIKPDGKFTENQSETIELLVQTHFQTQC